MLSLRLFKPRPQPPEGVRDELKRAYAELDAAQNALDNADADCIDEAVHRYNAAMAKVTRLLAAAQQGG